MDLELQLRAAEARRSDLERQHADALQALRGCGPDTLEAKQSRVRELEKKVSLETVRCEELQLELSSRGRLSGGSGGIGNRGGDMRGGDMRGGDMCGGMLHSSGGGAHAAPGMTQASWGQPTKGAGLATSASSHALGECSPPISPITMSHTTPSIYPGSNAMGHSSGYQSAASNLTGGSYITGSTVTGVSGYNSSTYNSLGHHYGNKSSIGLDQTYKMTNMSNMPNMSNMSNMSNMTNMTNMGTGMVGTSIGMGSNLNSGLHHGHGVAMGTSLGQPLSSVLDPYSGTHTNLGTSNLTSGLTSGVIGTSLGTSSLGTSMVPSSHYATSSLGNTTFTNPSSNVTGLSSLQQTSFNNPTFGNPGATSTLNQFSLPYQPVTTSYTNNVTFSNPLSSHFNSLPLSGGPMSIKLKPMDEVDLGVRRAATPVTPAVGWSVGSSIGGVTDIRSRLLADGLDSDWSGLHGVGERSYLNGHNTVEGQVDMLDIPGKGRCSVYIARFSYDPEPESEEELSIQAGDYLLVWGEPVGPSGYLDAELLDGRRGLVPSHFVQRLIGEDLLEFHQAVLSTLREEEINQENFAADVQRLNELAEMSEAHEDEGPEGEQVPAPKQLTLERQLNKSVLISWTQPDVGPGNQIESYHVYVDGVLKTTIKATERTRALVEGVDSNRPHRISVRSVTANRRTSRDAACTMIIGRDTHSLGPSAVRATNITSTQAVISWLPANSNHQHVVCVNNVEVRCVKPGVYRHTITGLTANTQYRVTVRAKHHRAAQNVANLAEDLPMPAAAHTDFRTLPKGLPDPPSDILVEPGPQDGTLLVTWHPMLTPHHPGSAITGYAVYADGKKVTDVDSPTGDHALIDISKLLGLNPKHVTVRTKARDCQSNDSVATPIPMSVLRGGVAKNRHQPHSAVMPAHLRQGMSRQQQQQQGQQVIEPDENLSDKEIFPNSVMHRQQTGIPSIEITKENYDANLSEDEMLDRRAQPPRQFQQQQRRSNGQQQQQQQQQQQLQQQQLRQQQEQQVQNAQYCQQVPGQQNSRSGNMSQQQQNQMRQQQMQQHGNRAMGGMNQQQNNPNAPPNPQKRARYFVALFDYDPSTMSPNPDACDEELPFNEGETIKVWGDKDADGFYWGESRGRRGYVPHNMVMELEGGQPRRWGDTYQNMPVKRMLALYDYDPQELSPNVDAEVELSFSTGQIINVYGEMDDDGFFMGEIDGVRGLVPSNFLTEAPDQYGPGQTSQGPAGRGQVRNMGPGPGARGPPPPPRDAQMRNRNKDACPVVPSQIDNIQNTATPSSTPLLTEHNQARGRQGQMRPGGNQQQQSMQQQYQQQYNNPQQQQQSNFQTTTTQSTMGGIFSSLTGVGQNSNQQQLNQQQMNQQQMNQQQMNQQQQQNQQQGIFQSRIQHKGVPQVIPNVINQQMNQPMNQQSQQQNPNMAGITGGPNLMQKLNEITAPGGDILSKGKELIFMKFGLGGK